MSEYEKSRRKSANTDTDGNVSCLYEPHKEQHNNSDKDKQAYQHKYVVWADDLINICVDDLTVFDGYLDGTAHIDDHVGTVFVCRSLLHAVFFVLTGKNREVRLAVILPVGYDRNVFYL